jgi:H+/Cl- antiporter ClcA
MNWGKYKFFNYLAKFTILSIAIGFLIGTATALFLFCLDAVTACREEHHWLIYCLPIAGLFIGWLYYRYGIQVKKGNNLIIEQYRSEQKETIPLIMAPLVLISTLLTHLVGGSAGREGTAVQMGGAIADQFTRKLNLTLAERSTLLIMGVSAGFSAVFGTPIGGAVFALEIMLFKNCKWSDFLPSILAAYCAHYVCLIWGVHHNIYLIDLIPAINLKTILFAMIAGLLFGLTAFFFMRLHKWWATLFQKIKYEPLRPFVGGIILVMVILFMNFTNFTDPTKFMGLGIPTISDAFLHPAGNYDFFLKILLTTFTLSAGFKGGEVTPLFFIGATLGNILIWFIPLPMPMLAGMGFVAVFAGATHAAITGIILGIEIFGLHAGIYIGIASVVSYFTSGSEGINSAQIKEGVKYKFYNYLKRLVAHNGSS